jgi:hypothetical protein
MAAILGPRQEHRTSIRRLDAVLGGPAWWALHLGGMYWLIPRACTWGTSTALHLFTVAVLGLMARAALSGVQLHRAAAEAATTDDPTAARDRFLAWTGLAMTVLFTFVVVAEWLPATQLDPCW